MPQPVLDSSVFRNVQASSLLFVLCCVYTCLSELLCSRRHKLLLSFRNFKHCLHFAFWAKSVIAYQGYVSASVFCSSPFVTFTKRSSFFYYFGTSCDFLSTFAPGRVLCSFPSLISFFHSRYYPTINVLLLTLSTVLLSTF